MRFLWRFEQLRQKGLTVPRPTSPKPNAHRKVTDEELLAVARAGLSIPEIATKLGIATQNAQRRIKQLTSSYSLHAVRDLLQRPGLLNISGEKGKDDGRSPRWPRGAI